MRIIGVKTIEEFKKVRDNKIQKWIDLNFAPNSIVWEMFGANAFKIIDKTGDSLIISLNDVPDWI